MFNNIRRAILSLIGVTLAFALYSIAIVPFVERKPAIINVASGAQVSDDSTATVTSTATNRFVRELSDLGFAPDSWELQKPTVLRTPQFTILLKDVNQLPDGSLQVKPCTLVFYSGGREADQAKRGPTIMQAPEGAILAFDRKIDLQKFKLDGKVTGGRLVGDIRIFRAGGPNNDDLEIVTRDIHIYNQRIFTRDRVSFRIGSSFYGTGSDLTLTRDLADSQEKPSRMVPDSKDGKRDQLDWMSELSHVQLEHLEVLHVRMDSDKLFKSFANRPGADQIRPAAKTASENTQRSAPATVKVRCKGPLHFDLQRMISTLEKDVTITREVPNQPTDTLFAEQVSLHLKRNEKKQPAGKLTDKQPAFEMDRIMAFGRPMVVKADSQQAYVETRHLEYNFGTDRIKLRSYNPFAPEAARPKAWVIVKNADHQIVAPAIDYVGTEDFSAAQLVAQGPGQYVGKLDLSSLSDASFGKPNGVASQQQNVGRLYETPTSSANAAPAESQQIFASWTNRLSLQPVQDQQVLKVEGNATVRASDFGELRSDNLDLWIKIVPVATRMDGTPVYETIPVGLTSYSAQGRPTRIKSPQISGTIQSMTIHFLESESTQGNAPNNNLFGQRQPSNQTPSMFGAPKTGEPAKSFSIQGGVVEAWVDVNAKEVRRLVTKGETRLVETSPTDDVPLEIAGSTIDFQTGPQGKPIVRLIGSPAELKSSKLQLSGSDIQLNGADNRVNVPGPGKLIVTYDPDSMSGLMSSANDAPRFGVNPVGSPPSNALSKASAPKELQKVEVQWTDQLQFDGQTAILTGEVTALGDDLAARTNDLQVVLADSVDFAKLDTSSQMPELARITANNPLMAGNRQRDEAGNITSYQQIVARNLNVDLQSGDLIANGPGWLAMTTTPDKLPELLARSAEGGTETGLRQLSLNFAQQLRGNLLRRELQMYDDIQGWFGPVDRWEERLNPSQIQELADGQFRLSCNLLSVYESPTAPRIDPNDPKSRKPFELIADNGAHVESQLYFARGNQITFAEDKGMLTMRGSEKRLAEFWQRNSPAERGTMSAKARTVQYNVKTGKMDARISDVEIDLSSVQSRAR